MELRSLAERVKTVKAPVMVMILGAVSLLIGITAGANVPVDFKIVFYVLVLSNVLILAYLLLIKNMVYGTLIYLYSLTFFNFYWRVVLPGHWPDLDIPRLVFVFIWLVFLMELTLGDRAMLPRTKVEPMMLAVVAAVIISMLTNGKVHIRQLLNGYAIPYAMFIIAKNVFTTRRNVDRFIFWLGVPMAVYFPVNAMFEHYRMTQFVFPRYILSPQIGSWTLFWGERGMGAFLHPSATGMATVWMFLLGLHGLSKLKGLFPRLVSLLITVLTPVAVFFTYTRAVYLGFFSSLVVVLLFSRRLRIFAIVVIVATALSILGNWESVTTEDRSAGGLATKHTVAGRLVLVQASMAMFVDHPFFGVGFQNFQEAAEPYIRQIRSTLLGYREAWLGKEVNQHNHFLNILTEIGLMGFIPLVLVYFYTLRILFKARSMDSSIYDHDFLVVTWGVFACYMANAMFMEPRFFEFTNVMPFLLAGIIAGEWQRQRLGQPVGGIRSDRSVRREGPVHRPQSSV